MLYPGADEADRRRAAAFASHYLARPIKELHQSGGKISEDHLLQIVTAAGEPLGDIEQRWRRGLATGETLKVYFILSNTHPNLASWNNATNLVQHVAGKQGARASRGTLISYRSEFIAVAHLWGAWAFRSGQFNASLETGYELADDFAAFLTEAEILRMWGQSWTANRDKAEPPLPLEVWQPPETWRPPTRQPGWPPSGQIPDLKLPDELVALLRPAGRPGKSG